MIGSITRIFPRDGYGLIQPDDGSPLVFVDVANFGGQWRDFKPGTLVRFSSLQGVRGTKAYNVMILATKPPMSADTEETVDSPLVD
jgi:cold shock CspA family protein